jgi:uncharacterized membrane protein (UPF0127 family)
MTFFSKLLGKKNDIVTRVLAIIAVTLLFFLAVLLWGNFHDPKPDDAPNFRRVGLSIKRADGAYFSYSVELAVTKEQEMYGLMFRHDLKPDTGMIFIYQPDQVVSMWMKNTYIPLDMLYVRADGTIVKIVTHAQPLDLTPLSSGEPVRAVIEINAGEVEKHSFKTGDKVLFSYFSSPS